MFGRAFVSRRGRVIFARAVLPGVLLFVTAMFLPAPTLAQGSINWVEKQLRDRKVY